MAYSKQTFTLNQVLTAAQMNQVETNIADHVHGSDGVVAVDVTGNFPGYKQLGKMAWYTNTAITLQPSVIHHQGTTEQFIYWDSQLIFTFGSSGSNPTSANLTATAWQYLLIDDNAVVALGSNLITDAQLINTTTVPTYSVAKHGWYVGTSRCIAAFRTNASSQLESFHSIDQDTFSWDDHNADTILSAGAATTFTTLSPNVPVSTTAIEIKIYMDAPAGSRTLYLSTDAVTIYSRYGMQNQPSGQVHYGADRMPLDDLRRFYYNCVFSGNAVYIHGIGYTTSF